MEATSSRRFVSTWLGDVAPSRPSMARYARSSASREDWTGPGSCAVSIVCCFALAFFSFSGVDVDTTSSAEDMSTNSDSCSIPLVSSPDSAFFVAFVIPVFDVVGAIVVVVVVAFAVFVFAFVVFTFVAFVDAVVGGIVGDGDVVVVDVVVRGFFAVVDVDVVVVGGGGGGGVSGVVEVLVLVFAFVLVFVVDVVVLGAGFDSVSVATPHLSPVTGVILVFDAVAKADVLPLAGR